MNLRQLIRDDAELQALPFDQQAAVEFARLRKTSRRIGTMDLMIAAIAISKNLVLVTRNVADFQDLSGLIVEDWTRP